MVSVEMKIESTANIEPGEPKILDETNATKDNNNDEKDKKEEKEIVQSSAKPAADTKASNTEPKNSTVRIVGGTKRKRLDVDPGEKKGKPQSILHINEQYTKILKYFFSF